VARSALLVVALVVAVAVPDVVLGSPTPRASAGTARVAHPAAAPPTTSTHLLVASTTDTANGGYWLAATDGGVFAFGAPFEGSAGALPLRSPVVGIAPTADGRGYRLVAGDGGVFAYGDAAFLGSMGGSHLNRPIVGMAATPDGRGYWLVASDGGIFAYGDARFRGSTGDLNLASPVVGMAPDDRTGGYRLVAADGGVFCFDAPFAGSAVGLLHRAAVSIDATAGGYRIVSTDGSVFAFGGAPYLGSVRVPPLVGEVVTIDPGHDGGNGSDPAFIDRPIDGGGLIEPCDTAGTDDVNGYPEHAFNFDVAVRLAAVLEAGGATVVLTRTDDTGVGPCVDTRAAIGNAAGSDAAVSIHGDGGPPGGSGFAVDVPVPVVSPISDNRAIVAPSGQLGDDVRDAFRASTGLHVSDYTGSDGIVPRGDLGGLDLSTVPKVLIECGNMQNPGDAALMESPTWRQQAADGLATGITEFLVQREVP
jgi:N-acetylmuramoyl-L-alanine amidase